MIRPSRFFGPWLVLSVLVLATAAPAAGQGKGGMVSLQSNVLAPKVPLADSPGGVSQFTLTADLNAAGTGQGSLTLDPNQWMFDEAGEPVGSTLIAHIKLNCTVKFAKTVKVKAGPPGLLVDWNLYEIQGPKITNRLSLVAPVDMNHGRLLVHDKNGKVAAVIPLHKFPDNQPCHPGCFPAGTPVQTPAGTKLIETLHAGDVITTVAADGMAGTGKVQKVSVTHNQLVKVQTEAGALFTTQTQPLCLSSGKLCPAGELKPGDLVYRWHNGKRQAVKVLTVSLTDRHEKVFNLVLGGEEVFIAGGFLARSKPPGEVTLTEAPSGLEAPTLPPTKQ